MIKNHIPAGYSLQHAIYVEKFVKRTDQGDEVLPVVYRQTSIDIGFKIAPGQEGIPLKDKKRIQVENRYYILNDYEWDEIRVREYLAQKLGRNPTSSEIENFEQPKNPDHLPYLPSDLR